MSDCHESTKNKRRKKSVSQNNERYLSRSSSTNKRVDTLQALTVRSDKSDKNKGS